jgi:hypothetical protein
LNEQALKFWFGVQKQASKRGAYISRKSTISTAITSAGAKISCFGEKTRTKFDNDRQTASQDSRNEENVMPCCRRTTLQ